MAAGLDTTQKLTSAFYQYSGNATQWFFTPHLIWRSSFGTGWTNDLRATYLTSTYHENDLEEYSSNNSGTSLYSYGGFSEAADADKSNHFWVRDRVSYSQSAGSWVINPALTASYEYLDEQYDAESETLNGSGYGNLTAPNSHPLPPLNFNSITYDEVFLTPSLDVSYHKTLDLLGGVLLDAAHRQLYSGRRAFPFASLSLDLLQLANPQSTSSLKIFGSYAQTTQMSLNGYAL